MGRFINESEFTSISYNKLLEADDDFGLGDDDGSVADDSAPKAAKPETDTSTDDTDKSTDDDTNTDDDTGTDEESTDEVNPEVEISGDPNNDISIHNDVQSMRMLKIYKDFYNLYDVFTDTQNALTQLMKRPDFYTTSVKLINELTIVLHELKIVIDSDFIKSKETVYINTLEKFQSYARYLMEIMADIESKV